MEAFKGILALEKRPADLERKLESLAEESIGSKGFLHPWEASDTLASLNPGRAAEFWLRAYRGAANEDERRKALEGLSKLGSYAAGAAPLISEALKREANPAKRQSYIEMLGRLGIAGAPVIDALRSQFSDLNLRETEHRRLLQVLTSAVSELGPDAVHALLPQLVSVLEQYRTPDPTQYFYAGWREEIIGEILTLFARLKGEAAELARLLPEYIDDESQVLRAKSREMLLGKASSMLTPLVDRLKVEPDPVKRREIIESLAIIATRERKAIPVLLNELGSGSWIVRKSTADYVGGLPEDAVMPLIAPLFVEASSVQKVWAMNVLSGFAHPSKECLLATVSCMTDKDPGVRAAAERCLHRLAQRAPQSCADGLSDVASAVRVAPFLAPINSRWVKRFEGKLRDTLLSRDVPEDRRRAAQALLFVDLPEPATDVALRGLLKDGDRELRAAALRYIFGRAKAGSLDDLARVLGDEKDADLRTLACGLLASHDLDTFLTLLELTKNADIAVSLLTSFPPIEATETVTRVLMARLRSESEPVKLAAVEAAGRLVVPPSAIALELLGIMRGAVRDEVRFAAIEAIANCGRFGAPAAADLARLASDERLGFRLAAISALQGLGPVALDQAPVLRRILADQKERSPARVAAARAIRDIAQYDSACLGVLVSALDDPNTEVANSAWATLGNSGRVGMSSLQGSKFIDEYGYARTSRYVACALGRMTGDNWDLFWDSMEARSILPSFPDHPIPAFSAVVTFDARRWLGDDAKFDDLHRTLGNSLAKAGHSTGRTWAFRDGFAVAAQFERYDPVTLLPTVNDRWIFGKLIPPVFSWAAFNDFFFGQRGDFRSFVYLLADGQLGEEKTLDWASAVGVAVGDNYLPKALKEQPLGERPLRILVYHYRSLDGGGHQLVPRTTESIPVVDQLRGARLWPESRGD